MFDDLAEHLIFKRAWERSFVHHLLTNGEGLVIGMVAATVVLIAVMGLVSMWMKSLRVDISDGVGSSLSCWVRCL